MKRGVPVPPRGPIDPVREGVGCRLGGFRSGDSGRGKEGLDFILNCGLGALAPGPTVCENLGMDGVGGVYVLISSFPRRSSLAKDGVVGVGGKESVDMTVEARFEARLVGKKMPAPGTEVVKYRMLTN